MSAVRIAIAGAAGRMGQAIFAAAEKAGCRVVGGTERADSPSLGKPFGGGQIEADVARAAAEADVWIDFTTPAATLAALAGLPGTVRAAIIGTTGLSPADASAIDAAGRDRAIVRSGNFSLGIAVLTGLVRQAATRLGADWDIEIVEAHHRAKIDAPSGTALMLGEAAAEGRGQPLSALRLPARDGFTGPRPEGAIGFAAIRGGGIVGDHDVLFAGPHETLRLAHHARDRTVFAEGALAAARWAAAQKPGLYAMTDVLGL